MKVSVLSQAEASLYEPRESSKAAIIRISDKIDILPKLLYDYFLTYGIEFYDVRQLMRLPSNWNPFSPSDAELIHKWFQQIKENNIEELVIHCHAGVSRSSAIGIAFGWFMNDNSIIDDIFKRPVAPNTLVLKRMAVELDIIEERRQWIRDLEKSMQDVSGEVEF